MIVPAATAYLLTDRLDLMIALAVAAGASSGIIGYYAAVAVDVSISGMMAVVMGGQFALAALLSPSHGIIQRAVRRARLRDRFSGELLLLHLAHHRTGGESVEHLSAELNWTEDRLRRAVRRNNAAGHVEIITGRVTLTSAGRHAAQEIAERLDPSNADRRALIETIPAG
jgi:manganese/zinc/iron transport system permease protein